MKDCLWPAAVAVASLVPASAALLGGALAGIAGTHVGEFDARIFAALGVTKDSPLPLRQAWFAALYLLLPLAGCAAACACAVARPRRRLLFGMLAAANGAAVALSAVASLLDD